MPGSMSSPGSIGKSPSLEDLASEGRESGVAEIGSSTGLLPAGRIGAGCFKCIKCLLEKPLGDMSATKGVCKPDHNSYKSLAERWQKTRSLKVWWESKDEQQKATWFVEHQNMPAGHVEQ